MTPVSTYAAAQAQLLNYSPDCVLLAPELSDGNGLDLIGKGTRFGNPPGAIVVLPANGSLNARLEAFARAADECLSKPIAPTELERRMRNVARQRLGRERTTIGFGEGFAMESAAYKVRHGLLVVPLTRSQFELLHCLLRHRGRVLSREQLKASLGGRHQERVSNAIDVHVMNLRHALTRFAPADFLETVRGIGYRRT